MASWWPWILRALLALALLLALLALLLLLLYLLRELYHCLTRLCSELCKATPPPPEQEKTNTPAKMITVRVELPPSYTGKRVARDKKTGKATLMVKLPESATIGELKAHISTQSGIAPPEQCLEFKERPLNDDAQTHREAGIRHLDTVVMTDPGPFVVHVTLPSSLQAMYGKSLTLETSPDATVASIKAQLQQKLGLRAAEMTLFFPASGPLAAALTRDKQTLGDAGVVRGSTLALALPHIVHIDLPAWLEPKHGEFMRLEVTPAMTVAELHAKISGVTGYRRETALLTFQAQPLRNDAQTLAQLGVESYDTIGLQYLGRDGVGDNDLAHAHSQLGAASLKCTSAVVAEQGVMATASGESPYR